MSTTPLDLRVLAGDDELMAAAVGLTGAPWPGLLPTVPRDVPAAQAVLDCGLRALKLRRAMGRLGTQERELVSAACEADVVVAAVTTDAQLRVNPASNGVSILRTSDRYILDRFDRTGIHVLEWLPATAVESVLTQVVALGDDLAEGEYACLWTVTDDDATAYLADSDGAMCHRRGEDPAPSSREDCVRELLSELTGDR